MKVLEVYEYKRIGNLKNIIITIVLIGAMVSFLLVKDHPMIQPYKFYGFVILLFLGMVAPFANNKEKVIVLNAESDKGNLTVTNEMGEARVYPEKDISEITYEKTLLGATMLIIKDKQYGIESRYRASSKGIESINNIKEYKRELALNA